MATVSPLWGSEVQPDPGGRHLESTKICHCRRAGMNPTPTVGPRWGSDILYYKNILSCVLYLVCSLCLPLFGLLCLLCLRCTPHLGCGEQTRQRKQSKQSNPNKGKHNEQTKYNTQKHLKYSKTRAWLLLMEKILVHSIFLCFIQSCSTGACGRGQEYRKYQ